jgi:hypothetical protein
MPLPFNISAYLKTKSVTRMRTFYPPRNLWFAAFTFTAPNFT